LIKSWLAFFFVGELVGNSPSEQKGVRCTLDSFG